MIYYIFHYYCSINGSIHTEVEKEERVPEISKNTIKNVIIILIYYMI